jgi:hypothetical protein
MTLYWVELHLVNLRCCLGLYYEYSEKILLIITKKSLDNKMRQHEFQLAMINTYDSYILVA